MTEPDRIFMSKYTGLSPCATRGEEKPSPEPAPRTEYIRRDPAVLAALPEVQAMIAAAIEVAAKQVDMVASPLQTTIPPTDKAP